MTQGIDVSKYQPSTPSLAGLDFLFARATFGNVFDASYAMHTANAKAAGLVVGAYHFGRGGQYVGIAAQVAAFLSIAAPDALLALDLEADTYRATDGTIVVRTPMSLAEASAFIAGVHAAGRKCGLYHSASGFPNVGQDWNWIAKWGTTPPAGSWAFWQYQGSPLDRDLFNGSVQELRALAGVEPASTYTITQLERLPEGTRFDCRGTVNVWSPAHPDRPIGVISGAVPIRWRGGITWDGVRHLPDGYPFVQVVLPGTELENGWITESDGEVLLPVVLPPAPEPAPAPEPTPIPIPVPTLPSTARKPERGPRQGRSGRIKDI